jgi:hypothetical protein
MAENMIGIKNSKSGVCQPIPSHAEINEYLARSILRKLKTP